MAIENHKQSLLDGSTLQKSLLSNHRDYILSATSYLAKNGGPEWSGPGPKSLAEWQSYGRQVLNWLTKRDDATLKSLIDGYPAYSLSRSPFYPD